MTNPSKFVLLSCLIIVLNSCSSTKWIEGEWEGTGYQIDEHTWEVNLHSLDLENIAIDYPDLSCGGEWEIVEKSRKQIIFKENLLYGTWRCDQGVEVHVSKAKKQSINLEFYLRSYDPINPIANARLSRKLKLIGAEESTPLN